jgi:hypothetical protein
MPTALPSLAWRTFYTPKSSQSLNEYEDAFAGDPERGRFAIADGATESVFAGSWARILVDAYVRTPGSWSLWLPSARRRWRSELEEESSQMAWYVETKFAEGAFAALLGVSFVGDQWHAEAIGDSCLFQVRDDSLRRGFPIHFANRPNLLGSRARAVTQLATKRVHLTGDWRQGDVFFLMTDALAEWFLRKFECRGQPWKELQALAADEFNEWIGKLRQAKELRNDDVTLVLIESQTL